MSRNVGHWRGGQVGVLIDLWSTSKSAGPALATVRARSNSKSSLPRTARWIAKRATAAVELPVPSTADWSAHSGSTDTGSSWMLTATVAAVGGEFGGPCAPVAIASSRERCLPLPWPRTHRKRTMADGRRASS